MKTIIITEEETQEPVLGFFGQKATQPILNDKGEEVRHILSKDELLTSLFFLKAGITKDDYRKQDWEYQYFPEKQQHVFSTLK